MRVELTVHPLMQRKLDDLEAHLESLLTSIDNTRLPALQEKLLENAIRVEYRINAIKYKEF